jgi:NitT/TauT family transport system ATP-binding protein
MTGRNGLQLVQSKTAAAAAIRVEGVTQRFAGRRPGEDVLALDNISLNVREGEFCCLLGPSGCGKSTLLNIIGGLAIATAGTVHIGNKAVRGPSPQDVAFVFQESTLLPWYTMIENFKVSAQFQGKQDKDWKDRAMLALRSVGMEKFSNHFPNQLSVGMRQRINLARGIYLDTPIILMDEPFAALDEQTRMVLGEDLSTLLARTGKTIVFVTHSLAEAVFLADTIVVMTARPGRVKATITVDRPHPRSPDFMLEPYFNEVRNELFALLRDEIRLVVDAMREARDS